MAKGDNNTKFRLGMGISLEGISDVPEGKGPADIFVGFVIGMFNRWADGKGGVTYQESKTFVGIKDAMMDALKTKEESVVLDRTQLKTVNKVLNEVSTIPFGGVEMLIRCGRQIEEALAKGEIE